jgi:hypothetical protein
MTTFTTQDRQDAQHTPLTIDQLDNIFGICALNTEYTFSADQLHEFARAIERAHGIGE